MTEFLRTLDTAEKLMLWVGVALVVLAVLQPRTVLGTTFEWRRFNTGATLGFGCLFVLLSLPEARSWFPRKEHALETAPITKPSQTPAAPPVSLACPPVADEDEDQPTRVQAMTAVQAMQINIIGALKKANDDFQASKGDLEACKRVMGTMILTIINGGKEADRILKK